MAGTSTALQALLQGQRTDRIAAFRSLGTQRIVQLESELAEARITLFGPLPAAPAPQQAPNGHRTAQHKFGLSTPIMCCQYDRVVTRYPEEAAPALATFNGSG